jgi:thioredoxin 1
LARAIERFEKIVNSIRVFNKEATIMGKITEVGDNNFEAEVLQSAVPVLVDFWAPWCGPCKAIAPLVEEIAGEYAGKLKVTKLNVDDHPATAARYGIRGIPNLLILKGGAVKEQIVGAVPKAKLVSAIEKALL